MAARGSSKMLARREIALFFALCMFKIQAGYAYSQGAWNEPELSRLVLGGSPANSEEGYAEMTLNVAFAPSSVTYEIKTWDLHSLSGFGSTLRAGIIASGYALTKNTLVMFWNGVVPSHHWAFPTNLSIRQNLTAEGWRWEYEGDFKVNFIGHPAQGMIYFSAGRVMGFGFYPSLFFSALGSLTWEIAFESQSASTNDLFATIPAGMSLGEIMFRLYMQAHAAGLPAGLTFLINPTVGFHRFLTGWEPPQVERNFYDISFHAAAAFGSTNFHVNDAMFGGERQEWNHAGPFGAIGFNIVYGDPFVQSTWVPFRHFEFFGSLGTAFVRHGEIRFFSDGYLFSFSPLQTETRALSTGLSLHLDYVDVGQLHWSDGTINLFSNALAWTVKYRRFFSPNIAWRARTHAGFMFFGASKYYYVAAFDAERVNLQNYGYGIMLKHLSGFDFGRRNRLDANAFFYFMWTFPGVIPLERGFVRRQLYDVSFSHFVSQQISLGATFSLATERGFFEGFPDTRKNHWSVRTFVAWNGQSVRRGN